MAHSLQRIFEAERRGKAKLAEAEARAAAMEAAARGEAEEVVRAAEDEVRALEEGVGQKAREAAAARRLELAAALDERARIWTARYEAKRAKIVRAIVAAVLGEEAGP